MFIFNIIRKYAAFIFSHAWMQEENEQFLSLITSKKGSRIVDLGCGDGKLTALFAERAKASVVVGVEAMRTKPYSTAKKVKFVNANLNNELPFKDNYFDIVVSHFSLEHLYNSGIFINESYRILKKGGYTIVATDNLSAWPNIFSLLLGWQPFSTTGGIGKSALGNPMSLYANFIQESKALHGEYSHNKVMAYQMLIDAYLTYGFKIEKVVGVGYFPFEGMLSKFFCKLDKRHAHFLIIKARK